MKYSTSHFFSPVIEKGTVYSASVRLGRPRRAARPWTKQETQPVLPLLCLVLMLIAGHGVAVSETKGDNAISHPDMSTQTVDAETRESDETLVQAAPLDVLKRYLDDQEAFERNVRAFDKLHVAIARAQYLKARELEQEGDAVGARSASQEAQENLALVKDAYDMGLAHFDSSAVLHNYYGELVHDYYGRGNEAAKHWNRAVQLDKTLGRAHNNLGMFYFHSGMYNLGVEHMGTALTIEANNPDFMFNMVQIYLTHFTQIMQIRGWPREKVYTEAMKLSERTVQCAPRDFEILRDHALNYFLAPEFGANTQWRKAARAWQAARPYARNDAERFNVWLNEARVHLRNNDRRRANECLEEARAIWPDSPVVKHLIEDFKE